MGTATSFTAARMLTIEQTTIVDGDIDADGNLILLTRAGTPINVGPVKGAKGDPGAKGDTGNTGLRGNNVLSGNGHPSSWAPADAFPGDSFVDVDTGDVYSLTTLYTFLLKGNIKGPQGVQGIQGVKGDQGDQGIQGIQGDQGPIGLTGVRGSRWYSETEPPSTTTGYLTNDMWLNRTNGDVYQLLSGSWTLIGNLKGPKGDQGIQGIQGVKGDKGDQGLPGVKGDKGDKGDQGIQGIQGDPGPKGDRGTNFYSGAGYPLSWMPSTALPGDHALDTTTGDVYVYDGGVIYVLQGNIKGPKGDKGDTGPAGPATGAPPGTIMAYAGATSPAGYLLCDGSAKSRSTYPDLFAVIGTTFGSNTSSDFLLPDFRGRIPVGMDSLWFPSIGGKVGSVLQYLKMGQIPSHKHAVPSHSTGTMVWNGNTYNTPNTGTNTVPRSNATDSHTHNVSAFNTGNESYNQTEGTDPMYNLQPSLTVNFIIKT